MLIEGTEGADSIRLGDEVDHFPGLIFEVYGYGGDDDIHVNTGTSTVYGGDGNDILRGGFDSDTMYGEDGDDTIFFLTPYGPDFGYGGDGDDTFSFIEHVKVDNQYAIHMDGGSGSDTIILINERNQTRIIDLSTGTYGDLITFTSIENVIGTRGDDTITGDAQNNILTGLAGRDTLTGGDGADTFRYLSIEDTGDTITDFDAAEGDRIDLSAVDAIPSLIGRQSFTFIGTAAFSNQAGELRYIVDGLDYLVWADADGDGVKDFSFRMKDQVNPLTTDAFIFGTSDTPVITGTEGHDLLTGSAVPDNLLGLGGDDRLEGLGGGDLLNGGDGVDTAVYASSATGVTVDLLTGTGSGGSSHNDVFIANSVANHLNGGDGNDTVVYKTNLISYYSTLTVDLSDGTVLSSIAAGDTLVSIENITAEGPRRALLHGDDAINHLRGGDGNDILQGRGGADILDGGDGRDNAYYADSATAVTVDLATGTGSGGDAEGDTLISIENLTGSAFDDSLHGDGENNILRGGAGDDLLEGRRGADTLEGGTGFDTASYEHSVVGVTVSLLTGLSLSGDAAGDTFLSIEGLRGSAFADMFSGDGNANTLEGGAGDDALRGRAGADFLDGGAGADRFVYGAVTDSTKDLAGRDTILDFSRADGDRIDLSEIDANPLASGDQAFSFLSFGAYTGTAGEVRLQAFAQGLLVAADTDGDMVSDLVVLVHGTGFLTSADFLL